MKKHYVALFLLWFVAAPLMAQTFPVETLLDNTGGSGANRVQLVILGDGYTASEQAKMTTDAKAMVDKIFQTSPYKEYKNYYQVKLVKVVSNQSGASHPHTSSDNACGSEPTAVIDNYFGSIFDGGGSSYHRLLIATKDSKINSVLNANTPFYNQVYIMVNTPYYGGSGGRYAVASLHSAASEIAIHELGHSFASLSDEYQIEQGEAFNRTANTDPNTVKWKNWLNLEGIGIFANVGRWFKPSNGKCKMEFLGTSYPFCAVCREGHVNRIHTITKGYDSYTPSNSATLNLTADQTFAFKTVLPSPNTLQITWTLNGNVITSANNASSYTLPYSSLLKNGATNTLVAKVKDVSPYVRIVSYDTSPITWTIKAAGTNQLPTVTLTAPSNNASYNAPATVSLTANAADGDGSISKVEFYNGSNLLFSDNTAPYAYSWTGVAAGTYTLTARAYDNVNAVTTSNASVIVVNTVTSGTGDGLTGNYFNGMNFEKPVYSRKDAAVNFNWGNGSPNAAVNADQFSVRWTGQVQPRFSGEYTFYITSDNGRRIWVNNQLIVDKWVDDWDIEYSGKITLVAGQRYDFRIDYFENNGGANSVLSWSSASQPKEVIPTSQLYSNPLPAIAIASPSNNASFNAPATIAITANASDNASVSKVEYFQATTKIGESTSSPAFGISWTNVAAGSYNLTAMATDNLGAVTVSGVTAIQVKTPTANVSPTITLTSPSNGASYSAPATLSLAANASDADGSVSKVEFYNGSQRLTEDATAPYSFSWTNVGAGSYAISAKVYDNSGAVVSSSTATVTITTVSTDVCTALPGYTENGGYAAGSKVKNVSRRWQCKEFPYSGWCNGAAWAYAPGTGAYWADAWYDQGSCTGRNSEEAEASILEHLSVVPNPASDIVTITTGTASQISIFNTQGTAMIPTMTIYEFGTVNVSEFPSGVYVVRIDLGSEVVIRKLVKN